VECPILTESGFSTKFVECPQKLRVVRYLPVRDDSARHDNGLRAGVGQASKEETAECTSGAREGYETMGIRATAIEVKMSAQPKNRSMKSMGHIGSKPTH
jgi:hypothetical protein